jgi:spore germination protein YaaH
MGFYTDREPGLPGSLQTALRQAGSLTYVCPFWYQIGFAGDGSIIPYGPGYDPAAARQAVSELQGKGIKVLALLHNLRLGQPYDTRAIFSKILGSAELRAALIGNVLELIRDMGFDGLNLDTEFVRPADRDRYTQFVSELAAALRAEGYIITADLPAKVKDDPNHSWAGGFDIEALAPHLDLLAIMAYDEHGYVTRAGPVASIGWVEDVVRYSVSIVPPEKILLGLAGHAFDWLGETRYPKYTSYAGVMNTAARVGAKVQWDTASQTPYIRYTDPASGERREAWFENGSSYTHKFELVERYGLGGIALWRLGLEDPQLWPLLRDRFDVVRSE